MSEFLEILLVIFVLFSVFRRYILFTVVNAFTRKMQNDFNRMQQQQNNQQQPTGRVTVEEKSAKKNKHDDDGEYVDFEEVKD